MTAPEAPRGSGLWIALTAAAALAVTFVIRRYGAALATVAPGPIGVIVDQLHDALADDDEDQGDEPEPYEPGGDVVSFMGR